MLDNDLINTKQFNEKVLLAIKKIIVKKKVNMIDVTYFLTSFKKIEKNNIINSNLYKGISDYLFNEKIIKVESTISMQKAVINTESDSQSTKDFSLDKEGVFCERKGVKKDMGDEELYLEATNEVEGENRDPALWSKAMALCDGDETKANYKYIRFRVKYLIEKRESLENDKQNIDAKTKYESKLSSDVNTKEIGTDNFEDSDQGLMQKYGISFDGEVYQYEDYQYERLNDAITYAKLVKEKSKQKFTGEQRNMTGGKSISNHKGFFHQLSDGDFGLAKTYWLYYVLVGVVLVPLAENFITSVGVFIAIMVGFVLYEIPVLLGMWRASNKYAGPNVWAVLAKIAVFLGWFWLAIVVLLSCTLFWH